MDKNIYIKALEIGNSRPNGILFNDLVEKLEEELDLELSLDAQYGLVEWFVDSFTTVDWIRENGESYKKVIPEYYQMTGHEHELIYVDFHRAKFVLTGKSMKQYIDYLELKESRVQANRAHKMSLVSICIAVATLLISVWFSIYSAKPPNPPYDVKIIEDKTNSLELENQIKTLKENLDKAEMLISIYESDSIKN